MVLLMKQFTKNLKNNKTGIIPRFFYYEWRKIYKKIPEYIYFVGEGEWIQGPYVNPKGSRENRKFKLIEVPMDKPKTKKLKKNRKYI